MPVVMKQSLSTLLTDPYRNFKFHINIHHKPMTANGRVESIARMGFMNMSGLSAATEVIPYREGGDNTTQRKMPGQTNFSDITLSRGVIVGTHQNWYWLKELFYVNQGGNGSYRKDRNRGDVEFRANMIVKIFQHPHVASSGTPQQMVFKVYNVWPTALAYSELDAGSNAIFVEQMTLAHEGFDIKWDPSHQAPQWGIDDSNGYNWPL